MQGSIPFQPRLYGLEGLLDTRQLISDQALHVEELAALGSGEGDSGTLVADFRVVHTA